MLQVDCSYCGTALPAGAMFCGECGRAATATSATSAPKRTRPRSAAAPVEPVLAVAPVVAADPVLAVDPVVAADSAPMLAAPAPPAPAWTGLPRHESTLAEQPIGPAPVTPPAAEPPKRVEILSCEQCGGVLAADDIFCGECGYLSRTASDSFSRQRDTAVIETLRPESFLSAPPAQSQSTQSQSIQSRPIPPRAAPAPSVVANSFGLDDHDDIEATRIVRKRPLGARFVLQFSTGESVTVHGTGLIGRNPQPEPAEFFDQLVRVFDPSKSVSKTHLEFGQEAGAFWVKDRFSGNGSVLREPDAKPILCHPDRRYRLERGARVDIGEQFFVVS
jgi:uncharacterized Zn finger protein (UPF0148 family)